MNISALKKILILVTLISVGFCGIYYVMFAFIKNKNEEVATLQHQLTDQTRLQGYMASIGKTITVSSSDIEYLNNSIVSQDGDVSFIEDLEKMGHSHDLDISINSLSLDEDTVLVSKGLVALKIKLRTVGTWANSYMFLSQLESLPTIIRFDSYAISRSSDGGDPKKKTPGSTLWQATYEIRVLKYK
jgi:Tfp pilus assembly protein PilO